MSKAKQKGQSGAAPQSSAAAPPDTDESDASSDTHSDDDMILRLAHTQTKAPLSKAHSTSADGSDEGEGGAGGGKGAGRVGGGKAKRVPPPVDPKKVAASEEWADKYAAKQEKRMAGRMERGKVVTVKQERQRVAKQAEVNSGVSSALAQLALKKKEKAKLKKQRRQQQHTGQDSEEDEDEDEEDGEGGEEEVEEERAAGDSKVQSVAAEEEAEEDDEAVDAEAVHYGSLDEEIAAYRELHHIGLSTSLSPHSTASSASSSSSTDIHSDPLYYPIRSFTELQSQFDLPPLLTNALISPSFKSPTPIQAQVWPLILAGKDVVGVASTGSGKTLGFLLGALVYILNKKGWMAAVKTATTTFTPPSSPPASSPPSPLALILSPTRELALQTFHLTEQACTPLHLTAMSLVGGPSLDGQLSLLASQPPDIIVATPGRLLKLLEMGAVTLSQCGFVVLDEADRMLDLGFLASIEGVLKGVKETHQTLLFTATWPPTISEVAMSVMRREKAMKVNVGSDDLTAAKSVRQHVEVVDRRNGGRERRLLNLLADHPPSPSSLLLIFTLYKRESTQLAQYLSRHSHPALPLNSSFTQAQRTATLTSFRAGTPPILVATDVAARGLDVAGVRTVVCWSVGLTVEHWVHRVGRCGRGGKAGDAWTFVVDYDLPVVEGLVKVLEEGDAQVGEELRELASRGQRRAAKHREEEGLGGDRLIAARFKNKGGRGEQDEEEDEDVEELIFGKDEAGVKGGLMQGKKPHAQQKGKGKAGHHGGRRGGR